MQFLKEELRVKILESSRKEFFENGFSKSSMRSIAKKSGITVGNIYRYFNGKNALFDEIVEKVYKELFALVNENLDTININQTDEFLKFRDNLIGGLVEIVVKNKKIVLILLDGASGTEYSSIKSEFYHLINEKIRSYFNSRKPVNIEKYDFISNIISKGCIEGFVSAIRTYESEEDLLDSMKMIFDYYFYDFDKRFVI